jgi:hypothetical protein
MEYNQEHLRAIHLLEGVQTMLYHVSVPGNPPTWSKLRVPGDAWKNEQRYLLSKYARGYQAVTPYLIANVDVHLPARLQTPKVYLLVKEIQPDKPTRTFSFYNKEIVIPEAFHHEVRRYLEEQCQIQEDQLIRVRLCDNEYAAAIGDPQRLSLREDVESPLRKTVIA